MCSYVASRSQFLPQIEIFSSTRRQNYKSVNSINIGLARSPRVRGWRASRNNSGFLPCDPGARPTFARWQR